MKDIMRYARAVLLLTVMVMGGAGCSGDNPVEPEPEPEPPRLDVEFGQFQGWPADMLFAPKAELGVPVSITRVTSYVGAVQEVFWAVGEPAGTAAYEQAHVSRRVGEGTEAMLHFEPEDIGKVVKVCVTESDDTTTCADAPNWRVVDRMIVALRAVQGRPGFDYDLIIHHLPSEWSRVIGRCTVPLFNGEATALGPFPDVSSDGTKVLCVDETGNFVEYPIYGESYGDGKKVVLRKEQAGGDFPSNPTYSPDGTRIAYQTYRPYLAEPVGGGPLIDAGRMPHLFTTSIGTIAPRQISENECKVEWTSEDHTHWRYVTGQPCLIGIRAPTVWAEDDVLFSLGNTIGWWTARDLVPVFRIDLSAPQFSYSEFVTETGIQNGSVFRIEPTSYDPESQTLFATVVGAPPTYSVAYGNDGANKLEFGDSFYWPDGSVSGRILGTTQSSVLILDQDGSELERFARGGTSNLVRAQTVPGWTFLP